MQWRKVGRTLADVDCEAILMISLVLRTNELLSWIFIEFSSISPQIFIEYCEVVNLFNAISAHREYLLDTNRYARSKQWYTRNILFERFQNIRDNRESDYEEWTCNKIPRQYISLLSFFHIIQYSVSLRYTFLPNERNAFKYSRRRCARSCGKTSWTILGNLLR